MAVVAEGGGGTGTRRRWKETERRLAPWVDDDEDACDMGLVVRPVGGALAGLDGDEDHLDDVQGASVTRRLPSGLLSVG